MIIGWIGDPETAGTGDGKTLGMTHRMKRQLEMGQAKKCITNYGVTYQARMIMPGELQKMVGSELVDIIIGVDEIHVFFDSRTSASVRNRTLSYFSTQTRKRRVYFHWTSQYWKQPDIRLRLATDRVVICKKVMQHLFYYRVYNPHTGKKLTDYFLDGRKVYHLFDTGQLITDIAEDPVEDKPKKLRAKRAEVIERTVEEVNAVIDEQERVLVEQAQKDVDAQWEKVAEQVRRDRKPVVRSRFAEILAMQEEKARKQAIEDRKEQ